MINPEPQGILIVRLFGRVRCVFCDRRIDRLIFDPQGVSIVHQERNWPPCDNPHPLTTGTGVVRPMAPVPATTMPPPTAAPAIRRIA